MLAQGPYIACGRTSYSECIHSFRFTPADCDQNTKVIPDAETFEAKRTVKCNNYIKTQQLCFHYLGINLGGVEASTAESKRRAMFPWRTREGIPCWRNTGDRGESGD